MPKGKVIEIRDEVEVLTSGSKNAFGNPRILSQYTEIAKGRIFCQDRGEKYEFYKDDVIGDMPEEGDEVEFEKGSDKNIQPNETYWKAIKVRKAGEDVFPEEDKEDKRGRREKPYPFLYFVAKSGFLLLKGIGKATSVILDYIGKKYRERKS